MSRTMETLYEERLSRYVTAMRNEKPDRIPIRPFVAEFVAKYAGYTAQEVTQDFEKAFIAARKCAADFDWDAVVSNMVYAWAGITQANGTKYYAMPGIELPVNTGFQYLEPPEGEEFMKSDEYDELTDDPTGFLYNTWLPRTSSDLIAVGGATDRQRLYRNNLAFVKGGMAVLHYFNGFATQNALLRSESGTVSAIAGILKAPLDIIADKLRGYLGLCRDLQERPEKVLAACEALAPHLLHVALSGADPDGNAPISIWMHRGCVPFVSHAQFDRFYWPTLKPIIQEIWSRGHQVLFYAEGNWNAHLKSFAELPDGSIIYHVDQADIFEAHRALGDKFCISGGIPNLLLAYGSPDDVRDCCKKVIDGVAGDGGYIMDASAIVQDDAKIENVRAMTDFTREYGVYSSGSSSLPKERQPAGRDAMAAKGDEGSGMSRFPETRTKPGACIPWEEKRKEMPEVLGDEDLVRRVWEDDDAFGNLYIWHCLLSF